MKLVDFWDHNVPSKRSLGISRRAFWPQKIGSTWPAYLYGGGPVFVVEYDAILRISHFVVRMTPFYGGGVLFIVTYDAVFCCCVFGIPFFVRRAFLFFTYFPAVLSNSCPIVLTFRPYCAC